MPIWIARLRAGINFADNGQRRFPGVAAIFCDAIKVGEHMDQTMNDDMIDRRGGHTAGQVGVATDIRAEEIWSACNRIMASRVFQQAPRMCRLLAFLIEKAVEGRVRETSEYAIGLQVFKRNPSTYSTSEDPIVRVQVGRLRNRLKSFYRNFADTVDVEIEIPLGKYMPVIRRRMEMSTGRDGGSTVMVYPFKSISLGDECRTYASGLHDEVVHTLFQVYGKAVVLQQTDISPEKTGSAWNEPGSRPHHRLEGGVQLESGNIKATIRFIDVQSGCVVWSDQFRSRAPLEIAHQEEWARTICQSLAAFLPH